MLLVLVRTDAAIETLDMIQREEALPMHGGQERLDVTIESMKKQGILRRSVGELLHPQAVNKLILATGMH